MADAVRERHGQLIVDRDVGDCMRACMSYLLDVPNSDDLPNEHRMQVLAWREWLWPFGLTIRWDHKACWVDGLWIASVPSKNIPDRTHAIVMRDRQVEFDPSPRRRYHKGYSLLGTGLVLGGYALGVHDPSLLGVDFTFREAMASQGGQRVSVSGGT